MVLARLQQVGGGPGLAVVRVVVLDAVGVAVLHLERVVAHAEAVAARARGEQPVGGAVVDAHVQASAGRHAHAAAAPEMLAQQLDRSRQLQAQAHVGERALPRVLAAVERRVSAGDLARIEQAIPPDAAAGERYNIPGMMSLDSERGRKSPQSPTDSPAG